MKKTRIIFGPKQKTEQRKGGEKKKGGGGHKETDLDEGEVGHERFNLFDDFRLGPRIERFELHGEYRLFFRLRGCLFACRCIICVCCTRTCGWNGGACRGECDFLDVQTGLWFL